MTGKLITLTTYPTRLRHYDSPDVYVGVPEVVASEPASVITLPDLPNGHGADFWIGEQQYSGVIRFDVLNPVTQSITLSIDRFPEGAVGPVAPVFGQLHVHNSHLFDAASTRWKAQGSTDFRMLKRVYDGEDVRGLLDQRKAAGANILRIASMKFNNTGWQLDPREDPSRYQEALLTLWRWMKDRELWAYQSVLLDTRPLGITQGTQFDLWDSFGDIARKPEFAGQVILELMNENGHPTQQVDPLAFSRQPGVLCSRGSGLTDADVVRPTWDVAGYSARRDPPPDSRGFTNYDIYEFQSPYPKECPMWAQEGMKPQNYGFSTEVAALMGAHASMGDGGFFHTDINSDLWTPAVEACARAFYKGIEGRR